MSSNDWTEIVGAIGVFLVLITVIVVVTTQVGAAVRAKARLSREAEFRNIAEKATSGQETIERLLAQVNDHLLDVRTRIDSIERVLKDVE